MSLFSKPSFLAFLTNGIFLLFVIVLILNNYGFGNERVDSLNQVYLLLLLSIAIGVHGLMHLGMEVYYDYNPLEYKKVKTNTSNSYKMKKNMYQ